MASRRSRHANRFDLEDGIVRQAMEIAALALNVPLRELRAATRERARAAFARQLAMYLAHVVGQLSTTALAAKFERDRTTVSYACAMIEDRRDSPMFDKQVEMMEREMLARIAFLTARLDPGTTLPALSARRRRSRRR